MNERAEITLEEKDKIKQLEAENRKLKKRVSRPKGDFRNIKKQPPYS